MSEWIATIYQRPKSVSNCNFLVPERPVRWYKQIYDCGRCGERYEREGPQSIFHTPPCPRCSLPCDLCGYYCWLDEAGFSDEYGVCDGCVARWYINDEYCWRIVTSEDKWRRDFCREWAYIALHHEWAARRNTGAREKRRVDDDRWRLAFGRAWTKIGHAVMKRQQIDKEG